MLNLGFMAMSKTLLADVSLLAQTRIKDHKERASSTSYLKEFKDLTIIISLLSVVSCLAFDMMHEKTLAGWFEYESILAALFLLVVISAISNFWQSRQFHISYTNSARLQQYPN